jgi:hypothetical protein
MSSDVTHLLERLEVFEEEAGVRLEALYAFLDGSTGWGGEGSTFIPQVCVNGELHLRSGEKLIEPVSVHAATYDLSGRLVHATSQTFLPKTFYGYETFSLATGGIPPSQIARIRVYPKRGFAC